MVPLFLSGTIFNLFLKNGSSGGPFLKMAPLCQEAPFFFLNKIMKKKLSPLCQRGAVFQNGSSEAPFWLHFFSECRGT